MMAWTWRPVIHTVHLILLVNIISMVICWWLWLHRSAYAVSPPSPILRFISYSYILLAIMVFPATINATQHLRISKLTVSVIVRAAILLVLSVSFATLMAAAALEEPPTASCNTASLAAYAINTFSIGVVMIVLLPLVPVIEIIHTRVFSAPGWVVDYTTFGIPIVVSWITMVATVKAVRLAAASHALVAATKPITGPFEVIVCALLALSSVIVGMFIVGHLPQLPPQMELTLNE
ncbi:hypothetical protein PIB30_101739 [Stylosanthes scabra]|uniref:Integral membrane protein n=1 Tax=Stylosanthes scabra TaxID=79078 RepID=A0ABU6RXI0_9FABA|nr:hypothetical protein [Stylosanthes scabra]